jgi:hypothetical protein
MAASPLAFRSNDFPLNSVANMPLDLSVSRRRQSWHEAATAQARGDPVSEA